MRNFVYTANPARVVFGAGTLATLGEEVDRLGLSRVMVLATPEQESQAQALRQMLGARAAGVFAGARMHTPVAVTLAAMDAARDMRTDGLVAVGGGSTTGLAKAIALRTDLPQIVVPTTYAGSEMTAILGETEAGKKTTVTNPKVLPEVVIYDVDLTLGLPVAMSVTSGMNAIAHAAEALYARDANPIISLMAEEAVGAMARALPAIARTPRDGDARSGALYAAWLAGACLGSVGMALHHKLCHTLGGTFDLPHAETHTAVLPHALAYNAPAAPEAMARLNRALGTANAPRTLFDIAGGLGAKMALRDLGMPADGIDRAVELAMANPYWNPRPLERPALRALLQNAWEGRAPL
jgi:alcohol dehydrogenase class IV